MRTDDNPHTLPPEPRAGLASLMRDGQGRDGRDECARVLALARRRGRFLLTAPEGSGKTVWLATLESLFKHGDAALAELAGVSAEGAWTERRYRVLFWDFARLYVATDDESIDIVAEGLGELMAESLRAQGRRPAPDADWETLFESIVNEAEYSSLVILVDNLDAPYLDALSDSALLRTVERTLGRFVDLLDAHREKYRFLLMARACALGPAAMTTEDGAMRLTDVSF